MTAPLKKFRVFSIVSTLYETLTGELFQTWAGANGLELKIEN